LLTACSALALAACGGGGSEVEPRTVTRPTIESAVAVRLASRSDKVASRLEDGDVCGAKKEAARLRAELTRAINGQSIPVLYLEDLSGAVNELEAQIPPCEVVQPPAPDTNGKEKGKKKGKKDKHDDEDHDESDD
jgi:hypothetical protein